MFKKKFPYIDRKGNLHTKDNVYQKEFWEYLLSNEIKDEESTKVYNEGFKEGYICGMQEMLSRTVESFFNSKEAKENKITKIEANLSSMKKRKEDIDKFDYYTNFLWF